eukprot:12131378-Alexandrium_andersonii.AAC.1
MSRRAVRPGQGGAVWRRPLPLAAARGAGGAGGLVSLRWSRRRADMTGRLGRSHGASAACALL